MFQILRRNPTAFWWSLGLHLILALLLLVGVEWLVPPGSPGSEQPVIEARIVASKALEAQVEQLRREAGALQGLDLPEVEAPDQADMERLRREREAEEAEAQAQAERAEQESAQQAEDRKSVV